MNDCHERRPAGRRGVAVVAGITLVALLGVPAWGQAPTPPKPLEKKASSFVEGVDVADKEKDKKLEISGWDGGLRLGATFSLSSSRSVVGQIDGETIVLGGQVTGNLNYRNGSHDWRNRFSLSEATSSAPPIDKFIKSNDALVIESLYFYRIANSWIGPFARFQFNTSLFEGYDVRSSAAGFTNYDVARLDGTVERQQRLDGQLFALTNPFGPTTLKESAGAFLNPLNKTAFKLEIWGAFSARQTVLANNQYAVNDDKETPQVELKELQDFAQAGPAAGIDISGSLMGNHIGYYARGEFMIPVIKTDLQAGDNRGAVDLTNVAIEAGVQVKVSSWAALSWQIRAIRDPQLIDAFQVQNMILLNFSYTLIKSKAEELLEKQAAAKKAAEKAAAEKKK